jgi:hypothetical protein
MKVYIVAPAKVYTGGPTALFQLCHALRRVFGIDSYVAFYDMKSHEDPVHDNYKHFQCPWISINEVYDSIDNVIIVPETATFLLPRFNKIRKIIYWLAVDNYVLTNFVNKDIKMVSKFIWFMIKNYPYDFFNLNFEIIKNSYHRFYLNSFCSSYVIELIKKGNVKIPKIDLHIAQSSYARIFIESYNFKKDSIVLIHEPIEEEFLNMARNVDLKEKCNVVTWNSRKAYPIAFKLVNLLKRKFKVIDLYNVGKENMIKALSISKIFIDIGFHPGRDRPVREAVALGNLALVNNHGGYYLREDCPVPARFKINCYLDYLFEEDYEDIYKNIVLWINNYEEYLKEFDEMRKFVLLEPQLFIKNVKMLVSKLDQL